VPSKWRNARESSGQRPSPLEPSWSDAFQLRSREKGWLGARSTLTAPAAAQIFLDGDAFVENAPPICPWPGMFPSRPW